MTDLRPYLTGMGTAALLALPLAAGAQTEGPALPQALSGLGLTEVTEERGGDDREIRATLDGARFQIEYDDGRLDELRAAPGEALPRAVIEAMLPAEVIAAADGMGLGDIVQVEFEDDGEIELDGMDADGPVEATFSEAGQMMQFDRGDRGRDGHRDRDRRAHDRRGPPDHAIRHDLTRDEVRRIAAEEGYGNVEWIEIRPRHVEFDATDGDGQRVEVRLDEEGRVERIERR